MAYKSVINIYKDKKKRQEILNNLRNSRQRSSYNSTSGVQGQAMAQTNRTEQAVDRRARVGQQTKGQSYSLKEGGLVNRGTTTKAYTYKKNDNADELARLRQQAAQEERGSYLTRSADDSSYASSTQGREQRQRIRSYENANNKYTVSVSNFNTKADDKKNESLKRDSSLNRYRGSLNATARQAERNNNDWNKWQQTLNGIRSESPEDYSAKVEKGRKMNPLRGTGSGVDSQTMEYLDFLYGSGYSSKANEGVKILQRSQKTQDDYKTKAQEYQNAALRSNQNIANNYNAEAKKTQQRIDDIKSGKVKVADKWGEINALNDKRAEYEQSAREYQTYADRDRNVTKNQLKMKQDPGVEAKIEAGRQKDTFLYGKDNADAYRIAQSMGGLDDDETLKTASMTMSEDERRQYYYTLAEDGEEAAKNYLRTLYNDTGDETGGLSGRFTAAFNQVRDNAGKNNAGVQTLNKVFDYAQTFGAGVTNATVGITDATRRIGGDESVRLEGLTQKIYQDNVEKGRVNKVAGDIAFNIGNMVPAIGVSIATGGMGAAPMVAAIASASTTGVSSFGNTYQQARREGFASDEATGYALLNGISEAALQYALTGVGAMAGGFTTDALAQTARGAIGRTVTNPVARYALQTIVGQSINSIGEFTEEYLQEVLDPVFRNWALGEANEFDPFTEEALYAGLLGALSAGVMNSVSVVGETAQYTKNGRQISESIPDLITQGLSFAPTADVARTASYLQTKLDNGGTITDMEAGLLVQQTDEALATETEIKQFLSGDINWDTMSDKARATLVTPSNAEYLATQYGLNVNESMSPDEMRTIVDNASAEATVNENRRTFDEYVQELNEAPENAEDIDTINAQAEQNRQLFNDSEKATGKQIIIADLDEDVNGYATADKIVINSRIANTEEGARFVLAHELTHGTEMSRSYNALRDSAKAYYESMGMTWEQALATEVERQGTLSEAALEAELVADFVGEELFTDFNQLKTFVESHRNTARRILSWLKNKFTNASGHENAILRQAYNNFERAFNEIDRTAEGRQATVQHQEELAQAKQEFDLNDLDFDEGTMSLSARQFSQTTFRESDYVNKKSKMAKKIANTLPGVTVEQAEKWIDDVTGIAKTIFDDQGRLDYEEAVKSFSSLRKNSEYGKTIDFSLICAKRRLYTGTMNLIRSMMPNAVLLGEDLARIRELMVEKGDEVACGTCYVETSRLNQDIYTSRFIEAYKESQRTGEPMIYINSEGKKSTLTSKKDALGKDTGYQTFVADPMLNPTMDMFLTTEKMNNIRNNYPMLALAYDSYMNHLGTAKPKAVETRVAYRHEINSQTFNKKTTADYNKKGGLRVNSFSDFETPHLIDMMQVVLDMASVGLKSHAYTKVPNFAWVFGDTGVKINCSLFGKGTGLDENGQLVFDDVEGMPHEEAFKLRQRYGKNVGTILVGMNEAHIRAALLDPRIDMVIPYHKSQMTDALAARFGLENYQDFTNSQNEVDLKTGNKVDHNINVIFGDTNTELAEDEMVWDFNKSELENTQAYLDLCEKLGRKPKFAEFLDRQGDKFIATRGYYKMLVDFRAYDNEGNPAPHELVKPNFNMEEANRVLAEYEGGADNLPADREVAEQFVKEFQQNKPGQTTARQYSKSSDRTILDNAAAVYGAIPEGENPVRESNIPKKTQENRYVSRYARTLYEAGATTDAMIPVLDSGIADEEFTYERIANAKLQKGAETIIKTDGIESARRQWDGVAERSDAATPQDIALGQYLYNEYVKANDFDNAIQVAIDLAHKATTAGQTVQAFRLLKKLTPDGQLYTLEKIANDYSKQLAKRNIKGFKGIEIDEGLAKQLLEAKSKEEIQTARQAIMQNIADQVPATWADKLNAWRYMAMLFNPRTHIRNVVGNAFFVPMRGLKDLIGAGMESAMQRAGKMQQTERTKTVVNPYDKANKALFDKAKESFDENVDIIRGEDKYGKSDIDQKRRIFKSRVLNWIDKFNSAMLEKEDIIFMRKAYVDSYAKAMKARGLTPETMTAAQENDIASYAIKEAQKATYRDANALASALNKFKRSNKFAHILGEGLFPFTKTPLNILKRGVEYSPIGIIKGTYQMLNGVRKGNVTAAEAIDSMASGISGSGILAIGAFLASQGLIKGGQGDDDEAALDSLQGGQSYALVIGDKSYTLDWAAPVAMPLFIGVEMFNSFDKDNEGGANFSRIVDSITKISDPLFNLSMLSSLNSAIDAIKYNEGSSALTEIGINVVTSYAGQFVPTISGQFARIIDPTQRKTFYGKDSNLPKAVDSLWQGAVKKIPGLSMIMQPSVDRWGRDKKTENITERVLENLASPGYYSERSGDDVDKEVDRLYVQVGDAGVIPPAAEKSIKWSNSETKEKGEINLTAEQYTKYSKRLGELCYNGVQDLIKSDAYKDLNDRERADAIAEIYDYAKNIAKNEITDGKYELKKWTQVLKDNQDVLGDYAVYKTKISGSDMDTKEKRTLLSGMKMGDDVKEQIYRASFSDSDIENLDQAQKGGASFNQFLTLRVGMDKIDDSNSKTKTLDKKELLLDKVKDEKAMGALWETFFETENTHEDKTLAYAVKNGVKTEDFIKSSVEFGKIDNIDVKEGEHSRTVQKKEWLAKNVKDEKALETLYTMKLEDSGTDEDKTIAYAVNHGVKASSFVKREIQKADEHGDKSGETKANYYIENGVITYDEKDKYISGSKLVKSAHNLLNSGYSDKEIEYFYQKEYSSDDDFVWMVGAGLTPKQYIEYLENTALITADKDENGKSINGSKKIKMFNAINSMKLTKLQKMLLFMTDYKMTKDQYRAIFQYINSLSMSRDEKLALAAGLGFTVENGRVLL